jgi:hypothetical protein
VTARIHRCLTGAALLAALLVPPQAGAIPSYSRKYATSCSTCHTVYPKLTHFGEAFRRNGYRFPGVYDTDYVKQDLIPMGQEAAKKDFPNSTWPSFMTNVPLLAFGVNSRMTLHPDTGSAAARADNRTMVSFDRLANSGSLYASGNIDETLTVRATVSVSDTGASLDEAVVVWSDIVGPRGAVSLSIGNAVPTLTAWARTSTYVGFAAQFALPATTLFGGAGAPFRVTSKYNLAELNGILGGRFEYGLGLAAGGHVDGVQPAENFYGHLAVKLGGMRLDGEGNYAPPDPRRPWAETSFTLSAFAYQSATRYTAASPPSPAKTTVSDRALSLGGHARLQIGSAELNLGGIYEDHPRVTQALDSLGRPGRASLVMASAEVSYLVFPWLVTALRVEHAIVKPSGLASASDTRVLPGIGMQLRSNVKLAISATLEQARGLPTAGGDWSRLSGSGLYLKPADNDTTAGFELSLMTVSASFYF